MEEPATQFVPVKRRVKGSWYGDGGTGIEKGRDLRERMSETLVPEAWAEAFSCWCQNVFLRACGQTEIKGN